MALARPPAEWRDFMLRHWLPALAMFCLLLLGLFAGLPWLERLAKIALFLLVLRAAIFFSPATRFFHGWLFWLFGPVVDGLPVWFTGSPRWPDLWDYRRRP